MKNALLLFAAATILFSCNKVNLPPASVRDQASVARAMGLSFETPYKLTIIQNIDNAIPGTQSDTIIFHENNAITETYNGILYNYSVHYVFNNTIFPAGFGDTLKDNNYFIIVPDNGYQDSIKSLFYRFNGGVIGIYISGQICQNNKPTLGIRLDDNWTDSSGFYYSYAHIAQ